MKNERHSYSVKLFWRSLGSSAFHHNFSLGKWATELYTHIVQLSSSNCFSTLHWKNSIVFPNFIISILAGQLVINKTCVVQLSRLKNVLLNAAFQIQDFNAQLTFDNHDELYLYIDPIKSIPPDGIHQLGVLKDRKKSCKYITISYWYVSLRCILKPSF